MGQAWLIEIRPLDASQEWCSASVPCPATPRLPASKSTILPICHHSTSRGGTRMVAGRNVFGRNPPMPNSRMNGQSKCRIFLDQPLNTGLEADILADQAHYLRHVMRLVAGNRITVFNGLGGEYEATVDGLSKKGGNCHIDRFIDVDRELPVHIHIIQCANKSEKIETVLQKCTELGAASFQIASSERSQFKLPSNKLESRLARWQKIIIEAAEQSERTAIPELSWHNSLATVHASGSAFVLHPESAHAWTEIRESLPHSGDITLAIGPEGGWGSRDLEQLSSLRFQTLTFGARIMRTETAAPALMAAIQGIL